MWVANLFMGNDDYYEGRNIVRNNKGHEVYLSSGGCAALGEDDTWGSANSIYDAAQGPSSPYKLVYNDNSGCSVSAFWNWWGNYPVSSASFVGVVETSNALNYDPNASSPASTGGGQTAAPQLSFEETASAPAGPATDEKQRNTRLRSSLQKVRLGGEDAVQSLYRAASLVRSLRFDDPLRSEYATVVRAAAEPLGREGTGQQLAEAATFLNARGLVEADRARDALDFIAASEAGVRSNAMRRRLSMVRFHAYVCLLYTSPSPRD